MYPAVHPVGGTVGCSATLSTETKPADAVEFVDGHKSELTAGEGVGDAPNPVAMRTRSRSGVLRKRENHAEPVSTMTRSRNPAACGEVGQGGKLPLRKSTRGRPRGRRRRAQPAKCSPAVAVEESSVEAVTSSKSVSNDLNIQDQEQQQDGAVESEDEDVEEMLIWEHKDAGKDVDKDISDYDLAVMKYANEIHKYQKPLPTLRTCVAWRTRSFSRSEKVKRVSYSPYFVKLSDNEEEDKNDADDADVVVTDNSEEDEGEEEDDDYDDDDFVDDDKEDEEEKHERVNKEEKKEQKKANKRKRRYYVTEMTNDSDFLEIDVAEVFRNKRRVDCDPLSNAMANAWRNSKSLEKEKKILMRKLEKMTSDHELSSHSSKSRSVDEEGDGSSAEEEDGSGKEGEGKSVKMMRRQRAKRNHNDVRTEKRRSLLKKLVDAMYSDGTKESTATMEDTMQNQNNSKNRHPLVFSFEDKQPNVVETLDNDEALAQLWAEFDLVFGLEHVGTYLNDECHEGQFIKASPEQPMVCSDGEHHLILDEQVGILCKICSFVKLEIRYILPPMVTRYDDRFARMNTCSLKDDLIPYDLFDIIENSNPQKLPEPSDGSVWDLIPGVFNTMYEHQTEAFEFMWTNLAGGIKVEELKKGPRTDVVGSCVICHAPGTGKTRLAIVFINTYMKVFPECRPMIIAPRGMLFAWDEEFRKWNVDVPFHIMNYGEYTGREDRALLKMVKNGPRTEKLVRLVKLFSWDKGSGILGVSYGLFQKLTSEKLKSSVDVKVRSILLGSPGLLILDEGHTPRNERSVIWKTLGQLKTEKRIILSGTPFQNNFMELYNILCLVRPQFAEKFLLKTPKAQRKRRLWGQNVVRETREGKGIWASITSHVTDDNAERVRSILKPFVHIHTGKILQTLPGLRESVIVLNPSTIQRNTIEMIDNLGTRTVFENEYRISLASIHPSLVAAVTMSEEEALLVDKEFLENSRSDPNEGVKTRFVIEVVRLCDLLKEKVLIFSQYIQPLLLIKELLTNIFNWREGKEILQMDGTILPRYRQSSIDAFNNMESDARVLLASTKACCEGISLTGASRVVLLDVVWNPAVGRQAISRAFRIGQKKFVYTYNLITYGTTEGDKYNRQAEKDHLSKLVFSPETDLNNVRCSLEKDEVEKSSKLISEDKILEMMTSHSQLKDMFAKIYYPPTESNIIYTYNQISAK